MVTTTRQLSGSVSLLSCKRPLRGCHAHPETHTIYGGSEIHAFAKTSMLSGEKRPEASKYPRIEAPKMLRYDNSCFDPRTRLSHPMLAHLASGTMSRRMRLESG